MAGAGGPLLQAAWRPAVQRKRRDCYRGSMRAVFLGEEAGMASLRRNVIVSVLFTVFGGPGIVLVYLPLWLTRFRVPAGEPWWQMVLAGVLIAAGVAPLV